MTPETEEKLLYSLGTLNATLGGLHDIIVIHQEDMKNVKLALDGSGTNNPGLKQVVAGHTSTISNVKKIFWIVFTPILAAVGGGVVAASLYLIHLIH